MPKIRRIRLLRCTVAALCLLLAVYLGRVLLLPLGAAAVLAYILLPAVRLLENWRWPRMLAVLLPMLAFFALLAAIICWGWPLFRRDFSAIGGLGPQATLLLSAVSHNLQSGLPPILTQTGAAGLFYGCFNHLSAWLADYVTLGLQTVVERLPELFGSLSLLIFAPVFAFYILKDRDDFAAAFAPHLPPALARLLADLNSLLQAFVRGYFLVALTVGVLFGLLLKLFGLDYSFTLGLLMLLAELIPYLGPFLAFFPCLLLGLVQGGAAAVKVVVIWLAVQQLENLVISPYIMAEAVRLHPLYIMLAVLVGGWWWGVFGMILAVPLAAALRTVWLAGYRWWQNSAGIQPEDWLK